MTSVNIYDKKSSPFPGLRPFVQEESDYFFGRGYESEVITGKLLRNRFIAITGSSGSGKSSLVQCGLIPRIRTLALKSDDKWHFYFTKPGNDPFGNLADSFVAGIASTERKTELRNDILKLLKESPDGVTSVIRKLQFGISSKILLCVDQFEELFRYGSVAAGSGTVSEASAFINLLTNAILGNNPDFYLVITLRSDLISECSHYRSFTNLVNNSNFLVSGIDRENIREIIVGPVRNAGAEINNDLVELLINEVNERTDQLPVLQHALMRTWNHWKELNEPERPLSISDYRSVGTMKDAVSTHADEVYNSLGKEGRRICEKLFKMITGRGSDNKGIRHPSNVQTIKLAAECKDEDLFEVIGKFRDPGVCMLTPDSALPLDDNSVIDLSHETLIYLWDRLNKWVDEEQSSVQTYLQLSEASALYQQGKAGLLKQPDLQIATNWRNINNPNVWWAQKYDPAYERAMVYLRASEKEFLAAEEKKARFHKLRFRKIRIISSILGGIAVLTAFSMIIAFISKISADNQLKIAEIQKTDIEKQKAAADNYATIILERSVKSDSIALAASRREQMERILRTNAENQVTYSKEEIDKARRKSDAEVKAKQSAIMRADSAVSLKNETQRLRMISVAKSLSLRSLQMNEQIDLQSLLAMQGYLFNKKNRGSRNDADIYMGLYNMAKQQGSTILKTFAGLDKPVKSIAFVPGKNEFYTSDSEGRVFKCNFETREKAFTLINTDITATGVLAVSPEGDWLACGGVNSSIKMIPIAGNRPGYELKGHTGTINSLIFSFDGKYLYSAALDGKVLKWDLSSKTSTDLSTDIVEITSIDLSSDNRYLAGISNMGQALVWNQEQSSDKMRIESPGKKIRSLRFKPDEERIAVGFDDGMVELWDIASKKKITEFRAHSTGVNDIKFNNRFPQIATAADESLKLWDTDDFTIPPVCFNDNDGLVVAFNFSPDGEIILSGSSGTHPKLTTRPVYADSFAADGCSYVTRNFTPDEWLAYIGKDITYEKTCQDADYKIKIREVR